MYIDKILLFSARSKLALVRIFDLSGHNSGVRASVGARPASAGGPFQPSDGAALAMLALPHLRDRLFGCASGFPLLPQAAFAAPHCAKRVLTEIRRVALSPAPLYEPITRVGRLDGRARRGKRLEPPSHPQLFAGIPPRVLAPAKDTPGGSHLGPPMLPVSANRPG